MNMTVVIISKRPAVALAALLGLLLVLLATLGPIDCGQVSGTQRRRPVVMVVEEDEEEEDHHELPANMELVRDERLPLDDEELGSIVKDFGEHLKETMEEEMERLISEVESVSSAAAAADWQAYKNHSRSLRQVSEAELARLKEINRAAGEDIQARIELAGDNKGALPQMGLGAMATSFTAAASGRLAAAGSYIGNKMRALSDSTKAKIPARLRRFFKWPNFMKFKVRFHKTYKSLREELYRQMIFLRTNIVVSLQHVRFLLGRDKHLTGQNQYSDWTEKEYHEKEGNQYAERSAKDLDPSALQALSKGIKTRLEQLAKSGKNIFGQTATGRAEKKVRKKREAMEDEADELNESEDDDFDGMELGNELEQLGGAAANDDDEGPITEEDFKLVDEFANDLDLSDLENIDDNLDSALNVHSFKKIDLRDTGCIIKAENQNGCGCCYSYTLHSAASYYNCMEKKLDRPERYHARFVADCGRYLTPPNKYPAVNSCRGGRISWAYAFAQIVGVQRFAHYNIARVSAKLADPESCVYPRPASLANHGWHAVIEKVPMFNRSRFVLLRPEEVDLHLRTVGPVVVNVRTWKNFKLYEAGIIDKLQEGDSSTLHSMLIVGHDKDPKGRNYWIILNSHGIVWGEYGYLRVYVDALENFAIIFGGLAPLDL